MGKKFTFEALVEMRKNNHEEFLETVFKNFPNNTIFDGEIGLQSIVETEKNGKTVEVNSSKWIYLTDDEKSALLDMAKNAWHNKRDAVLRECKERFEQAKNSPYLATFDNPLVSMIVCASLDKEQKVPEWLFVKACRLFDKHRENEDVLWKSYMFKGFVRWSQIEQAMKFKHSNSKSE